MTTFEYLAVLISIIVGLGITQLLGGVARIITHRTEYRLYWIHLVWTGVIFLNLVVFWWDLLSLTSVEEWTYSFYVYTVLLSVLLYLLCGIIMPSDFPKDGDFRNYFFTRRKWFFGTLLAALLMLLLGFWNNAQMFPFPWYVVIAQQAVAFALTVTAMITKNAKFHGFFALYLGFAQVAVLLLGLADQTGLA